jgi:CubicO group peptidase (beta-lactamase class C family)
MSTSGLSPSRLTRMRTILARHVERGEVPGLVTLVSRRGETHIETIGAQSIGGAPIQRDTIFRLDSLTKPLIAAATMILVEECTLRLDDPVERFLPELADRRVLARPDGPLDATVPANRPITVRDLLTFRLGFGIVMAPPDTYPIQQAVSAQQLGSMGPPKPATPHTPDEWLRRFATLPLIHQPGERWLYNTGFYLLGILLARASGQPLETLLRERLFDPLGMKDTAFSVPPAKLDRLAACYLTDDSGALQLHDDLADSQWGRPPIFPDAAAGLVSTIDDYHAFGQLLLNGGKHGNARILSRPTVETMITDQITPEQKANSPFFPGFWDNRGWGLGLSIVTRRDEISSSPGRFGWDGGYGTSWYADPREGLSAILLIQCFAPASDLNLNFWTSVYQSLDD